MAQEAQTETAETAPGAPSEDAALWAEFDRAEGVQAGESEAEPEPGDQAAQETAPAAEQKPEPEPAPEPDIWADAPEAARTAFQGAQQELERLRHDKKSNEGRVSALQRRIDELERAQTQKPQAAAQQAAAAANQQAADFLQSDDWKGFAEEYPEIAGPLGKVVGTLQRELSTLQEKLPLVDRLMDDRRQDTLNKQESLLAEAHPDWAELDRAALREWLGTQPRHIREAAQRNADTIVDAEEAADVVGRFKAWRDQQNPGHQASPQQRPPLSDRRQRQLDSARTTSPRSLNGRASTVIPDDPAGAWTAFERMGL